MIARHDIRAADEQLAAAADDLSATAGSAMPQTGKGQAAARRTPLPSLDRGISLRCDAESGDQPVDRRGTRSSAVSPSVGASERARTLSACCSAGFAMALKDRAISSASLSRGATGRRAS